MKTSANRSKSVRQMPESMAWSLRLKRLLEIALLM